MRKFIPALLVCFVFFECSADEPPPIALSEGHTITTAIAEHDGDYESIKRITKRRKEAWLLSYSASIPTEGAPRIVAAERILHDVDSISARIYRSQFEDGVEEDYPGTTALGASTQILEELKRNGTASFSVVGADGCMAQALMVNRNLKYRGELQRRSAGVMSVLVNGQVVSLPVVIAAGRFSARQDSALDVEFCFLDGAVPIALQWRIGQVSLRVVRIDSPTKQSALAQELATNKRAIIPGLYFDFSSAVLRPESNAALPAVVGAIRSRECLSIGRAYRRHRRRIQESSTVAGARRVGAHRLDQARLIPCIPSERERIRRESSAGKQRDAGGKGSESPR